MSNPPDDFPAYELVVIKEHTNPNDAFAQLLNDYQLTFPDSDITITEHPSVDPYVLYRLNDSSQPLTIQFGNPVTVFGMRIVDMGDHDTNAPGKFTLTFEDSSEPVQTVIFEDPFPNLRETGVFSLRRFLGLTSDKPISQLTFEIDPATGTDGFALYDLMIDPVDQNNPIPEPITLLVFCAGIGSLGTYLRKRTGAK